MYVSNTAYYYLGSTLGLGEDSMLRITLSHPTILGLSVEDNIRPTLAWLVEALSLTAEEVVEMVRRQPEIVQLSVAENLEPTLEWFQLRLGLNPKAMGKFVVRRFPAALCYSCDEGLERKVSFLVEALGFSSGSELGRLVIKKHPSLLSASVSWNLAPTVAFLDSEFGLRTQDGSLLKAVVAVPPLLSMSLEHNLLPKAHFFKTDLEFTVDDCKKLFRLSPVVLSLSLDSRLIPLVAFLQAELGLTQDETRKVLLRFPRLPTYSLHRTIRPRVRALRAFLKPLWDPNLKPPPPVETDEGGTLSRDTHSITGVNSHAEAPPPPVSGNNGIATASTFGDSSVSFAVEISHKGDDGDDDEKEDDEEEELSAEERRCVASVLCRCPGVLALELEPKLAQLTRTLGLSGEPLRRAVFGLPSLLTYSVQGNLLPKVSYLTTVSGSTRAEVLEFIARRSPLVFGLSLDKRLHPRCRAILRVVAAAPGTSSVAEGVADAALEASSSSSASAVPLEAGDEEPEVSSSNSQIVRVGTTSTTTSSSSSTSTTSTTPVDGPLHQPSQLLALIAEASLLPSDKFEVWLESLASFLGADGSWQVPVASSPITGFLRVGSRTWDPRNEKSSLVASALWESRFQDWCDSHAAHGQPPASSVVCSLPPRSSSLSPQLARWVRTQRKLHSQGTLPLHRVERLVGAGVLLGNDEP